LTYVFKKTKVFDLMHVQVVLKDVGRLLIVGFDATNVVRLATRQRGHKLRNGFLDLETGGGGLLLRGHNFLGFREQALYIYKKKEYIRIETNISIEIRLISYLNETARGYFSKTDQVLEQQILVLIAEPIDVVSHIACIVLDGELVSTGAVEVGVATIDFLDLAQELLIRSLREVAHVVQQHHDSWGLLREYKV